MLSPQDSRFQKRRMVVIHDAYPREREAQPVCFPAFPSPLGPLLMPADAFSSVSSLTNIERSDGPHRAFLRVVDALVNCVDADCRRHTKNDAFIERITPIEIHINRIRH